MLRAVEHIRRARGGSQAQVMRTDDGELYLLKLQNNPQGTKVLANELLACRLARKLGLPVPEPAVIELDEATIRDQNISFILGGRNLAPRAGLQFLEWSFPDSPLRGTYPKNSVYDKICGWDDFEPWLSRIERFPEQDLFAAADDIPPEWYDGDREALDRLLESLLNRRLIVRDLIDSFRVSHRNPFTNWGVAFPAAAAA